mmetsp:Transcript_5085/g.16324  ORF Transcript_5085/g.16324 Transcript_5085/m.16324 type:complete len:150 (+) Transcript_5085:40-489(+)
MSAETRDRLAEILLAHGPMADTTATSARTLEQIDHSVSESLSAIHALDAQVQQESPDNAAIRDGIARLVNCMEGLRSVSCPADLRLPMRLVEEFVDADRSPDDFTVAMRKLVEAVEAGGRAKSDALASLAAQVEAAGADAASSSSGADR